MIIQKPIEFKVMKGQTIDELEQVVNVLLREGWVPHGDWRWLEKDGLYTQAMVKMAFAEITMNQSAGLLVPR